MSGWVVFAIFLVLAVGVYLGVLLTMWGLGMLNMSINEARRRLHGDDD